MLEQQFRTPETIHTNVQKHTVFIGKYVPSRSFLAIFNQLHHLPSRRFAIFSDYLIHAYVKEYARRFGYFESKQRVNRKKTKRK